MSSTIESEQPLYWRAATDLRGADPRLALEALDDLEGMALHGSRKNASAALGALRSATNCNNVELRACAMIALARLRSAV